MAEVFTSKITEEEKPEFKIQMPPKIVIGPLRFFEPYDFTFSTVAKGRWYNRKLIDVFSEEFKRVPRATLEDRINQGKILVNGKQISLDYVIQQHDKILHTAPRIESPTYNVDPHVIGETDEYIAIYKPPSLPIHATGGYFYNSLIKQIGTHYFPVHRLDRVTSGIIVMAKSMQAAKKFTEMLDANKIHKTYVARVLGQFPTEKKIVDLPILESKDSRAKMQCGEGGKESKTEFELIKTNGKESIVRCHPITGRTHQIRVHLAAIGFPISNDTFYGGTELSITQEENQALTEAKSRGLLAEEIEAEWLNHEISFQIYLRSVHYQCDLFDFQIDMPEWAKLD